MKGNIPTHPKRALTLVAILMVALVAAIFLLPSSVQYEAAAAIALDTLKGQGAAVELAPV